MKTTTAPQIITAAAVLCALGQSLTLAAFRRLRDAVKRNGTHYRRNGEPIED